MNGHETRSELKWASAWSAAIVLIASIPYIWGAWLTPPGYHFLGLTHNIDDGAVYLSWMRQVADGRTTYINLFTNEPVKARQFNVLFLAMGGVAGITHVPLIWVYHIFRLLLGVGLILTVWQFSKLFFESANDRRLLIPLVGLSAGVGWLMPGMSAPTGPVDNWQPEAITFLSIYLNPLFAAALILMVGAMHFLVLAERTSAVRHAVCAGLCLLVLGNVHTYDVVTVACMWGAYVIVVGFARRRLPTRLIGLSGLAAIIAAPSVAYQYHLYRVDPIFRARANSPTPSPAIWSYFAGYGLVLLGALCGMWLCSRASKARSAENTRRNLLPTVWAVVGFVLPYIPIAQQRKLVMGLHIPLCMLCTCALSTLTARLPRPSARGVLLAFILLSSGSNLSFLVNDMNLLAVGRTVTHYAPYLSGFELDAMDRLRKDADWRRSIFAPPTFALFTPALTGHRVYYGHWSETPDYAGKLREWMEFVNEAVPVRRREQILLKSKAEFYVAVGPETRPPSELIGRRLFRVYHAGDVAVYAVSRAGGAAGG